MTSNEQKCNVYCEGDTHAVLDVAITLSLARRYVGHIGEITQDPHGLYAAHGISVGDRLRVLSIEPAETDFFLPEFPLHREPVLVHIKIEKRSSLSQAKKFSFLFR